MKNGTSTVAESASVVAVAANAALKASKGKVTASDILGPTTKKRRGRRKEDPVAKIKRLREENQDLKYDVEARVRAAEKYAANNAELWQQLEKAKFDLEVTRSKLAQVTGELEQARSERSLLIQVLDRVS